MTYPPLDISHHDSSGSATIFDELIAVHEDAHSELLERPFYTTERFAERLHNYLNDPGFALVAGRLDGALLGYAFGGPLSAATGWWTGLEEVDDPDATRETGSRTFALREFLMRKNFQGRGYGHAMHDALLSERPEERATLLVREDNPARDLYLRWGWRRLGHLKPFPDSPRFVSLILPLVESGRAPR